MRTKQILLALVCALSFTMAFSTDPTGLKIGDKAPSFKGRDQNGKTVSLEKLLEKGPVLITFYRGQWCRYCNRQMSALQDSLYLFHGKNVTVVAITPEKGENVAKTVEKTKATFHIVADNDQSIMDAYKTTFTLDDKTQEKYKGYGIDLPTANEKNTWSLPVPATYLINQKGEVQYVYFNIDYSKRVSVKEILEAL